MGATPSPSKIPSSIAQASKEELEKILVTTLHKLKARDRQIAQLEQQFSAKAVVDQGSTQQNEENFRKRLEEDITVLQEGFAKERDALEAEHARVVRDLIAKEQGLQRKLEESKGLLEETTKAMEDMKQRGISDLKEKLTETKKELMEGEPSPQVPLVIDAPDPDKYVSIEEYDDVRKEMADVKKKLTAVLKKYKVLEQREKKGKLEDTSEKQSGRIDEKVSDAKYQQLKNEVEFERNRFKKALVELKRRNEALTKEKEEIHKAKTDLEIQIEALRAEAVAESRKAQEAKTLAEQTSSAFKEYKQRAHMLLKSKEDELKEGRSAVKEEFDKELADACAEKEKASKQVQELTEELETLKAEVAAKVHTAEKRYKDELAEVNRELEIHKEHARTSTRQYEQLRIRYDSYEDRYQSLKNELAEAKSSASRKDQSEMEGLKMTLDRSEKERKSLEEVNEVMQGEIVDLKAIIQQLKLTLAMKSTTLQTTLGDVTPEGINVQQNGEIRDEDTQKLQEQLAAATRKVSAAEREVDDLEKEVALHSAQEKALKETVRDLQRELERIKLASKTIDMEYFKNILLKLFETGEEESILPVVGTILQFSPDELRRCQEAIMARQEEQDAGLLPTDATTTASKYISNLFGFAE